MKRIVFKFSEKENIHRIKNSKSLKNSIIEKPTNSYNKNGKLCKLYVILH